jgi:hypothetical protein
MTQTSSIDVIVYSYKGKKLYDVVNSLLTHTDSGLFIHIVDQHPINRSEAFKDMPNINYRHIFWDFIYSPTKYKSESLQTSRSKFFLIISDDIIVQPGWDKKLIEFIDERNIVVSGQGETSLSQEDKFMLTRFRKPSTDFTLSNFIDRNFIFGSREALLSVEYPSYIKYHGEEEQYSLDLFKAGIDIYSAPFGFYSDMMFRTIDNLYTPFSKEHNYNLFVDNVKNIDSAGSSRSTKEFIEFHKIDIDQLYRLPFQNQDVEYDPNSLEFQNVDSRKFAAVTKAIY